MTLLNNLEEVCRHTVDIENDYFDKDGLVDDMVNERIFEYENNMEDEDENDDRSWIDMALGMGTSTSRGHKMDFFPYLWL